MERKKVNVSRSFILQKRTVINQCQKQPSRGVLKKRCSENIQQMYWRTPVAKCDFNKVAMPSNFIETALRHGSSPATLLKSHFDMGVLL